ncbi:MAG: Response regulator containing a CheY-like receiver domain and a domain [Chlorobi bacterium]|nr:Response regulator containing a CheY-like receiver domain and a domain [Chlorobiota bacterium]
MKNIKKHDACRGSAGDAREKIAHLLQRSEELISSDYRCGIRSAREALRLARRLDDPRLMVESLFMMENYYFAREQYPRMLEVLTESGVLLERIPDEHDLRVALCHKLGSLHLTLGDLPKGLEVLTSAFDYLDRVDARLAALILGTTADTYLQLGYYPRAFELLGRVEKMAEENGFRSYVIHCMECTGRAFMMLGDYDRAIEKFRSAALLWNEIGERLGEGAVLGNIASILANRGDHDGALEMLAAATAIHQEFGTQQQEAYCLLTKAGIVIRSSSDEALDCVRKALAIFESIGDRQGRSIALADIGEIHVRRDESAEALSCFLEALRLAQEIGYRAKELLLHESLGRVHEMLGDTGTSLKHYKRYMELERELDGHETKNAMAMAQARAEIERAEKEKEIALLRNAQLQLEMERKSKELTAMALRLVRNNELMDALGKEIGSSLKNPGDARSLARTMQKRIEESTQPEEAWRQFEEQFQQVHHGFLIRLHDLYPALRPAELKICALLKINLSSKEIATMLNISFRTVELHRTNIRKKLALPNTANLSLFLTST